MYTSYSATQTSPVSSKVPAVRAVCRSSDGDAAAEDSQPPLMLCCYQNRSPMIQILRSVQQQQAPQWHLERVVFPGQRLLFEAPAQGKVQVSSSQSAGTLVDDTLACDRIRVQDN